ncbi:lipopolysaccharide biosynthesis protein [Methanoplanus limicola]|uniref:Polysaccharide biosynthesis protein n=1 Tax=Methanoplanus limicola DSM 2279 TaxID=937775 RepID=H1YZS2_9EURY|nr:hypothetical protein [Methanoplanus limicola]EHQ34334.1 polysaccharide biosynthesis protein [Methanoplanus limicola DSM 2279]
MKRNLTFYSIIFIAFLLMQRGSGLITKLILANAITPYEYGLITLVAISLPTVFQILMCLNFNYILSHAEKGRYYFRFSVISSVIIGIIISLLLLIYQNVFFEYLNIPMENRWLFYWALIISMFSMGIIADFQGLLTGLRLYSIPGMIVAIPSLVRLILIIILLTVNNLTFEIIIILFALSNTIPLIYLLFSKRRESYLPHFKEFVIPGKKMLAFGTALLIIETYSTIGILLIKIVVSHDLGIIWQGYFDVSLTLVTIAFFFLGTMNFLSVPEATNSNNSQIDRKSELGKLSRTLFSQMFFFLIVMYFYSDFIVGILFPEKYSIAGDYCYILIIGFIFLYIQNYLANLNISFAETTKEYFIQVVYPLSLLPFYIILTDIAIKILREYNYDNGFAGPYLSYCLLAVILTIITIINSGDIKYLKIILFDIEKLIIAFIITASLIYLTNPSAIAGIFISFALYNGLLILSGYMDKKTIADIFKI